MNWHQDLREQRKTIIIEAAASVFGRKGYQRATMREIAKQAGISPGTIYLYFENKRDLLLSIAERLMTRTLDQQLRALSNAEPEELLRHLLEERLRFVRENEPFIQVLASTMWTDTEMRERFFGGIIAPLFTSMMAEVQARVDRGELRPCRVRVVVPAMVGAFLVFGVLRTLAPQLIPPQTSDTEIVEELVDLYTWGLVPQPEEEE